MDRIINDVDADNYKSPGEQEIYLNYNRMAKSFFKLWFSMGLFASIVYHVKPLEFRLKAGNKKLHNTSKRTLDIVSTIV